MTTPLIASLVVVMVAALLASPASAATTFPTQDLADFVNLTHHMYVNKTTGKYFFTMPKGQTEDFEDSTLLVTLVSNKSMEHIGWDFLHVAPVMDATEEMNQTYYNAGYAEGYLTWERVWQVYYEQGRYARSDAAITWMNNHVAYMKDKIYANDALPVDQQDAFWSQVGNLMMQMEGIAEGFSKASEENGSNHVLTFADVFKFNFQNEIEDVEIAVKVQQSKERVTRAISPMQHCSALVKVTDGDIFFSHDTWSGFNMMVRQYKTYAFATTVSMSGYAGLIASGDDWYINSNMIAVQETTNEFYNDQLGKFVIYESVSEFLRVMVATFIGDTTQEWVKHFSNENSGTYCNQWMVLDYKLYTAGQKGDDLADNLFWVAEQIPGNVSSGDMTPHLREHGYWASYNEPYFKNIFDISGFAAAQEEYGEFFSYTKYARAEIFARNETMVHDLESMRGMMRYNNWQHDNLSLVAPQVKGGCADCDPKFSPMLTVASRGDLVPADAVLPPPYKGGQYFGRGAFGAIDSKIASSAMIHNGMQATVISGPTHMQQPVFSWGTEWDKDKPLGAPDTYNFEWVEFNSITPIPTPNNDNTKDDKKKSHAGMIAGIVIGVVVVLVGGFFLVKRCNKPEEDDYRAV